MRKEKSRDAARSRRSKENHEFYELAKLLPLPAAITSQLDFLDKASIIRLTISFLKLRQFSVNGHPPWAPDFTTLGSVNPYSSQSVSNYAEHYASGASRHSSSDAASPSGTANASANYPNSANNSNSLTPTPSLNAFQTTQQLSERNSYANQGPASFEEANAMMIEKSILKSGAASLFDIHQGTHILQSLDGFAFAIGRDGRFLYISETVSMYLGLSQVEMTGSSVFDYTHQQDHEELAAQLGIAYNKSQQETSACCESSPPPGSVLSQYSAASSETLIEDHLNQQQAASTASRKKAKAARSKAAAMSKRIKVEQSSEDIKTAASSTIEAQTSTGPTESVGIEGDPLVRQFCIRMKSTLTKRGCQHFKSSGYRVVHVVAHMRAYQSNDHGHLMDPLDECELSKMMNEEPSGKEQSSALARAKAGKRRGPKIAADTLKGHESSATSKPSESNNNNVEHEPNSNELKGSPQREKLLAAERRASSKIIGMVAVAIALPPPTINELRLDSDTFVLRLGLDLRVSHIEPKITELLKYPLEALAGKSLYSIVHPADVAQLRMCHAELLKKGQMMSGYYRLLAQSGGYIWIQTCATLICNNSPLSLAGPSTLASGSGASSRGQSNSPMPMRSIVAPVAVAPIGGVPMQQPATAYGVRLPICGDFNYGSWRANQMPQPSPGSSVSGGQLGTFEPEASQQVVLAEQQQEQCVIFVNYMITDLEETDSILDVCQSQEACQMVSPTSLGRGQLVAGHQSSGQNSFSSPVPSCESPAGVKSLRPAFASASMPSSVMNLTSPQQQQQPVSVHQQQQQQQQRRATNGQHHQNSSQARASKHGHRRTSAASSKTSGQQRQHHRQQNASYSASLSDTNGSEASMSAYSNHKDTRLLYAPTNNTFQQLQENAHQAGYVSDVTTDGVTLTMRQQQQEQDHYHHHHQQHQHQHQQHHQHHQHQRHATFQHHNSTSAAATNLLESPSAALAADYAAGVDRSSIYKAATFAAGLAATEAVAAAGTYGTQQAAAAGAYQQAAGYYHNAHHYYHHTPHAALHHPNSHTNQTPAGWQDSSTNGATTAANSNLSAAAAAAAVSLPSYYNYHGYYGNRFI